jgi:glycosyltransferase involved in cell wall biosynthesis
VKISIVTVSLNQGKFVAQAIRSVLDQEYRNVEYIVVDAGSQDGSRETIDCYRPRLGRAVFDTDRGPADGLNKGFSYCTGDIYGFLNADDYLLPGALTAVSRAFTDKSVDVLSGHVFVVNETGTTVRKSYSDHFDLKACAYRQSHLMQPSTFFRKRAFEAAGYFNIANLSNWDGELFVEFALQGCRFIVLNRFLSAYRVHGNSITGSGRLDTLINQYEKRMFEKIIARTENNLDILRRQYYRVKKSIRDPRNVVQRALYGSIYRRAIVGSKASPAVKDLPNR